MDSLESSLGSYHFVLVIDGGAATDEMLRHFLVSLRSRALQRRVTRLKEKERKTFLSSSRAKMLTHTFSHVSFDY